MPAAQYRRMKPLDKRLLEIYEKSFFFVQNHRRRLVCFNSKTARRFSFFKIKKFAVITAWNPMNRKLPLKQNRRRNLRLKKDLEKSGRIFYATSGFWRGHSEESFTVEGIPKSQALRLGAKYRQYAVMYHDKNGIRFLRCSPQSAAIPSKKRFVDPPPRQASPSTGEASESRCAF